MGLLDFDFTAQGFGIHMSALHFMQVVVRRHGYGLCRVEL